jgi:hypothetical protein
MQKNVQSQIKTLQNKIMSIMLTSRFLHIFFKKYFRFSILDILKMSIFENPRDFFIEFYQQYILFIFELKET